MNKLARVGVRVGAVLLLVASAMAVKVGDPAPNFSAIDNHGKVQKLSAYRGKYVVLEWHNQGCPYTRKYYESGNMQQLQKKWTDKGVIWFTVISSAPGTQGFVTPTQENDYLKKMNAAPTAVLMDMTGTLGRLYDAKTTPEMFVISPNGAVMYEGAMDDRPTKDQKDITGAKNYVDAALSQAMANQPVTDATTRPYGCSVKFKRFGW
ncbi:MAG TPA: redoxin domain-containing protein [Candidatus Angelobacter sp.]|nr:redoxin domain-containing protein [Candidatus Angelobacter sp.]